MADVVVNTNITFKDDGRIELTDPVVIQKIEALLNQDKKRELTMFYLTQGAPQKPVDLLCTCRDQKGGGHR